MDIWERGGAVDSSTALRVEQHADHVVVKLNLPTHRNAISAALITEPDAICARLEEGVADAADIDRAMELGYRHTMGPLRSTDLVGLDVRLAIAEHLYSTLGSRYEPPKLLREKVSRGELGRKSGHGFFTWDTVDTGAP